MGAGGSARDTITIASAITGKVVEQAVKSYENHRPSENGKASPNPVHLPSWDDGKLFRLTLEKVSNLDKRFYGS